MPDDQDDTVQSHAATACVHEIIDARLALDPQRPACIFRDRVWSCSELDARADIVAKALRGVGVGPGTLVAVSLPRSLDLLAALLGVWRAGGAYVPLDPTLPQERLHFMLADAAPVAAIVSEETTPSVASATCPTLGIETLEAVMHETRVQHRGAPRARSTDLAYVLYTSGSTGQPKGVAVAHRNVANFFTGMDALLGHQRAGTWLAITSFGFDISVLELFWTLARGFRVVIQEEGQLASATASVYSLPQQIKRHSVTHLQCTPSLARLLVRDAEATAAIAGLKQLVVGGEALPRDLARQLARLVSGQVFNLYGPTETTVWSSAQRIDPDVDRVSIGKPLANTSMYVLDESRKAVQPGETGELYIGGLGVAVGYLNRPELTAERFITNPLTNDSSDRVYRTGDLVRSDAEGRLEFLGRIDQQVKLRGVRIELEEIEVALRAHPAVGDAAVRVWEARPGDARLVAYVVAEAEKQSSAPELQRWLAARLPDTMVPGVVAFMDALPRTPNGKLDRQALPTPQLSDGQGGGIAPSTELEEQIAAIWADVLGVPHVGVTEPFFQIGGHSLLMVEVQDRLREVLRQDVTLVELFRYPTVSTLAVYLANRRTAGTDAHTVADAVMRGQSRQQALARRAARAQGATRSADEL